MCLVVDWNETEKARKRKPDCWVTRYKILSLAKNISFTPNWTESPALSSLHHHHDWKVGVNKGDRSKRPIKKKVYGNNHVNRGIHVYKTLAVAREALKCQFGPNSFRIVALKCCNADLIAAAKTTETYYRVTLSKRAFTKAMKPGKKAKTCV